MDTLRENENALSLFKKEVVELQKIDYPVWGKKDFPGGGVQSLKVVDIPSSVSENGFLEHY
jgi:hypothetical protein